MPQSLDHLHTGVWSFLDESQEGRITRLYMPKWVSYDRANEALARMEHQLAITPFLAGDAVTLADISLLAYTRLAHEGGFHLEGYAAVRRWIAETEKFLGLPPAR